MKRFIAQYIWLTLLCCISQAQNIAVQADADTGLLWRPTAFFSNTTNKAALVSSLSASFAPATSGTALLYGNGSGGFSSAAIGGNLSFSAGTLNTIQGIRATDTPTFGGLALNGAAGVSSLTITKTNQSSESSANSALLIQDQTTDPDATGSLLTIKGRTSAPSGRYLFDVRRTGGIYIWDYLKISPDDTPDTYAGSAMLAVASDLDSTGTAFRVRNRVGHDIVALNDDPAYNRSTQPDDDPVKRVLTVAGSVGTRAGLIVWGSRGDAANAAIYGVRDAGNVPYVEMRNGTDAAYAGLAASTLTLGQSTPASGVKIHSKGIAYFDQTAANHLVLSSSGSHYGTVQNTGANQWALGYTTTIGTLGTEALSWTNTGEISIKGSLFVSTNTLSGAGAVPITKDTTKLTSSGASQALTLANGTDGQIKRIIHDVDGGSMVLTPTTKTGFSTVTFTNAGDSVTLEYVTTRGWIVVGSYGVTIAP
jgi:hypothetical protein